jgi:chitin disaccharide deacetylase
VSRPPSQPQATGPRPPRRLVVNADDLGLSRRVNDGIFHAHDHGIVTSASLMVRRSGAAHAAAGSRVRRKLAVGLHLDLGEWVLNGGEWRTVEEVVPDDDVPAVEAELRRQLAAFRDLVGQDPTHIDSHQHVHLPAGAARAAAGALADELGVPLRGRSERIRYCGDFYGQTGRGERLHGAITAEALTAIVRALPAGITELACHPGRGGDHCSPYARERELELRVLCDERVGEVLQAEAVQLCSFAELTENAAPRRQGASASASAG